MENIESVLSTFPVTAPTDFSHAPAVDWEAKFRESMAQHQITIDNHGKRLNDGHTAMQVISDMFFDEAEKRDWCKQAVEFIEDVNGNLPRGFNIPLRKRMFTVTTRVWGRVGADVDVEVEASTQEEADRMIDDNPDDHFDPDEELRKVNMRTADIEDIEVEVV
jgi:hypothetical protein